ncbi:ATP-binding protein [Anaerolentibacter hominis]|uniref:ATP-binding protein n=1 Tax=Anaerolentibacter hominis TaxID=3079009 RepID=UPI0031B8264E
MALRNDQYNRISRDYDRRRFENKHNMDLRREEIYAAIPELTEIDNAIVSASMAYARELIYNNSDSLEELQAHNESLALRKKQLLTKHGYPADYLEPVYSCPDCQDTGYVNGKKCHCFKQAIVDLVYAQSNIKAITERENFSHFSYDYYSDDYVEESTGLTPCGNIHRIVKSCRSFIEEFDTSYQNLFIYGNTGVGKTFLLNCIAKELLDSAHSVLYFTAPRFFEILSRSTFGRSYEEALSEEQYYYIYNCDLLIIDDLGTELNNSFVSSQLYQCINERHLNQRSTVISTNLSWNDLTANYSERIFSRITSEFTILKITGDDIRLKKGIAR